MKQLVLSIIFLLIATTDFAQAKQREIRRFEVEPSVGWNGFIAFSLEGRYNFRKPWDIGIKSSIDMWGNQHCVVGDYNVARGKDFSFFCGFGAGFAIVDILDDRELPDHCLSHSQSCFYLMPRVGVELSQHLRLSFLLNTYNFKAIDPMISLGIAFGGGKKKTK